MPGPPPTTQPIVFAGWTLDPATRQVWVRGEPARLGDRAFDLLLVLASHPGMLLRKGELMDRVWPDRVVEENNLSVQVAALRRLLGPDVVQNVSGVGYRLAAWPQASPAQPVGTASPPRPGPLAPGAPEIVGRDAELARLRLLVGRDPLVTVVGPGGVGKTTLAHALLRDLGQRGAMPSDGSHWIDLAPVRTGTPLLPLVARTLGLALPGEGAAEDIARALSTTEALVVLDNCEHLVDDVATLMTVLLSGAPRMHWLATSQEVLRVSGETVFRLGPLSLPGAGEPAADRGSSAALALFCARAEASGAGADWTAAELSLAADLCRRLDGLPLALEIAAARVATLGLEGVARQLDQRLRMRAARRQVPERQHSLMQTYEWSYGLLSPEEQRVFRSLAVFAGGFTAELAQRLHQRLAPDDADAGWSALDALQALVDKSLVQAEPGVAGALPRLSLFESAREFARLQLQATGEAERVQRAHAGVLADWMEQARAEHDRLRDREWAARHAPERRNVRAALDWACTQADAALLARLVAALGLIESALLTASELATLPLPIETLQRAPASLRGIALLELAWAHHLDGSGERATDLATAALADFEALADEAGAYLTLTRMIRMHHRRSGQQARSRAAWERLRRIDPGRVSLRARLTFESSASYLVATPRSVERHRELQALAESAGFDDIAAICQVNVIDELMVQGRDDEVVAEARAALAGGLTLPRRRALASHNLALALMRLGRLDEGREAALVVWRTLPSQAYLVLDLLAYAAAREKRLTDAALVAGCSEAIRRRRDVHPEVCEAALIEDTWRRLRAGLGEGSLQELARAGEAMEAEQALQRALGS